MDGEWKIKGKMIDIIGWIKTKYFSNKKQLEKLKKNVMNNE